MTFKRVVKKCLNLTFKVSDLSFPFLDPIFLSIYEYYLDLGIVHKSMARVVLQLTPRPGYITNKFTTKELHKKVLSFNLYLKICYFYQASQSFHTSQNSFNKWTKISILEITIFDLKMMVKSGLEFFVLKFTEPFQRYTVNEYKAIIGILQVFYQLPGNPSAPI